MNAHLQLLETFMFFPALRSYSIKYMASKLFEIVEQFVMDDFLLKLIIFEKTESID